MNGLDIHFQAKDTCLVEQHVKIGKMSVPDNLKNSYSPEPTIRQFKAWNETIEWLRVYIFISFIYEFEGTSNKKAFSIQDVFLRELNLEYLREDLDDDEYGEFVITETNNMFPRVLELVGKQLEENGLTEYKTDFSKQLSLVDVGVFYRRRREEEKSNVLNLEECTDLSYATERLNLLIQNAWKEESYHEFLKGANSIIICEVSPDGSANDIYNRMKDVINSLGRKDEEVFYYIESGEKAMVLDPDISDLMNLMSSHFNVVKWILGSDPEGTNRYTKAVVGIITR